FAQDLFDETFEARDVVLPRRLPLRHGASEWKLTPRALDLLHEAWRRDAEAGEVLDAVRDCHPPQIDRGSHPTPALLHQLLRTEFHVVELQRALEDRSVELSRLADVMDGFPDPQRAVVKLVDLGIAARPDERSAPLIPARYHLFLRASEGAYVCWSERHPAGEPRLILDRHEHCPACAETRASSRVFETAVCRHCGVDYLVGTLDDDKLSHAPTHQRSLVYVLRTPSVISEDEIDEDEVAVSGPTEGRVAEAYLCPSCGTLRDSERP